MTTQITTPINVSEAGDKSIGTGAFDVVALNSAGKLPAGIDNAGDGMATTARVLGTVYQNTTGKALVVTISVNISNGNTSTYGWVKAYIGATSSPATQVAQVGDSSGSNNGTYTHSHSIVIIVPIDYYYKFESDLGGFTDATVLLSCLYSLI